MKRALVGWGVLALAMVTAPARAADDGGTESVFAFGAGNRGLGMGSAFVAAADDASAIVWNAAGLGLVRRAEFQVVQTGDLGLGFRENYASLVLPSWRFGTVALGVRTFGVGGIERRDERNVLLEDDLSSQEMEVSAGYGRAWGRGLNVGGTVKLRRQSLAGLSASGLGLDAGVQLRPAVAFGITAPWAQAWSWGLAVHDLVSPSLRLDRDDTRSSTRYRTGLAWRRPVGFVGEVLAEMDIETSGGANSGLCAGLEYRPVPWFALRGGTQARGMAGGTSVHWRDLSVDYAFQDAPMVAEHRVGLTWQFGATTEESRERTRRREDEALERRLGEAFQHRQAEQIAALVARAEDARARGALDEALEALSAVQTLDPGNAAARALETACRHDKAVALERSGDLAGAVMVWDQALSAVPDDSVAANGVRRCRAELDHRSARTAVMRERFTRALDAFAAGRLGEARIGFAAVVAENPADTDAATMLRRTDHAIARRASELVDQASRLIGAGRAADALPVLEQARALDPHAPGLEQAFAAHARATQPAPPVTATPAPAAAPAPRSGPRWSDAQAEQFYQQGLAAAREQRLDDALRLWELVWSSRPGYRQVNALLVREYLTRGIDAFAAGRLTEAIASWEKVLRVDPTDARAKGYLARAQQQLARSRAIPEAR